MKANNIAELEAIEAEYMQIDEHWGWKFSDGSCGYYGNDYKFHLYNFKISPL